MSRLDDPLRLAAIERLDLLGRDAEHRFDRVVRLARRIFDVPVVAVNIVDADHQISVASVGLESTVRPASHSICATAVESEKPVLLNDARADPGWAGHPAVSGDGGVAFYAGQPLRSAGQVIGTLCLADTRPRELTDAEDRMLTDLASWVEQELATDQEQREAVEVQRRLLPRNDLHVPGLTIAGHCRPARSVGGDFYDWQDLGPTVQVVLADVMGKGMTAAVIAAGVRALLRGTSPFKDLAGSVTRAASDSQDDLDDADTFVTMFAARIDPGSGDLEYVDAGHGLALVLELAGTVRRLYSGGLPLGTLPGEEWETATSRLEVGETLLVVSDGVLDAFSDKEAALAAAADLAATHPDPDTAVRMVVAAAATGAVADDVSVIAVRRDPA